MNEGNKYGRIFVQGLTSSSLKYCFNKVDGAYGSKRS